MSEMLEDNDYLAVVAIDLGTSYSGYAFQTRTDFINNSTKIHAPLWYYGNTQLVMGKTITSILFNPNKEFDSFGFEAEEKFAELGSYDEEDGQEGEQGPVKNWYFLRHFKMLLYTEENISQRMVVTDFFGKKIRAMEVFSAAIQYLKNKACMEFEAALGDTFRSTDLKWVLTVPAIWGDRAKQFMRTAAEKAGILRSRLVLALEPEVAAFFCKDHLQKYDDVSHSNSLTLKPFDEGCSFLVVDCGGGTVDITTYRIEAGSMKELQQASGGDVGGERVSQAFFELWIDIIGEEKMAEIQSKYPSEILDLQTSFKLISHQFSAKRSPVSLPLPQCILENLPRGSILVDSNLIQVKRGKACIPSALMLKFFENPIREIIQHVENRLNDVPVKDVTHVLMVGVFSECSLLHDRLADHERLKSYRIIRPFECSLAVLKGAVTYGFRSDSICERITRCSYGISSSVRFDETKHKGEDCKKHVHVVDSKMTLEDVFCTFVKVGEPVKPHMTSKTKLCRMRNSFGKDEVEVYVSQSQEVPMFVCAGRGDCTKLGVVEIKNRDGIIRDRYYEVTMYFGYTELKVKVTDKDTQKEVEAALNLLG